MAVMTDAGNAGFAVRELGRSDYVATGQAMQAFTDASTADTRDEIWLTEHATISTL